MQNPSFEEAALTAPPGAPLSRGGFGDPLNGRGLVGILAGLNQDPFSGEIGAQNAFEAFFVAGVYVGTLTQTLVVDAENRFLFGDPGLLAPPPTLANLTTGLRLGLGSLGEQSEVTGCSFVDCGLGIAVRNLNPNQTPFFYPHCNTFVRTSFPGGDNVGIRVEPDAGSTVIFDSYQARQRNGSYFVAMKNLFAGQAPAGDAYVFLDDQTGTTPTYTAYIGNNAPYFVNDLPNVVANSSGFAIQLPRSTSAPYDDANSCSQEDNINGTGFNLRVGPHTGSASAQPNGATVAQNAPNPAADATEVAYRLPGAQQAELVVRDMVRGAVVRRVALNPASATVQLDVHDLPNGLYTYSLVADGATVGTRKLLVNH